MTEKLKKLPCSLLVTITGMGDTPQVDKVLKTAGLPMKFRCKGEGTATNDILSMLGLGISDKDITLIMAPNVAVVKLMSALTKELDMRKPGHGIAFSIPMSGISSPMIHHHADGELVKGMTEYMDSKMAQSMECIEHSLILITVNQGYSEEVMDVARSAGAAGGTVVHARRLGLEETFNFWGISVQREKEVIAILAPKEKRLEIMQMIGAQFGMRSEAQGVTVSLPVNGVAGLE